MPNSQLCKVHSMASFKVPDSLAKKYRGSGIALAASVSGELVDLVYLEDASPSYAQMLKEPGSGCHSVFLAKQALELPEVGPTVRRLQALGEVHAGMLSGWELFEV